MLQDVSHHTDKPPNQSGEFVLTSKLETLSPIQRRVITLLVIFFETSKRDLLQIAVDQLLDYILHKARKPQDTRRQYPS